jgi:hypothetical protein
VPQGEGGFVIFQAFERTEGELAKADFGEE